MANHLPEHPRVADRRAPEPLLLSADQLRGRAPIRLRRRTDKVRLAAHVVVALGLMALTAWWVLPKHAFAGPVLLVFAPGRGVHAGDLPSLAFVGLACRSLLTAVRLGRRP